MCILFSYFKQWSSWLSFLSSWQRDTNLHGYVVIFCCNFFGCVIDYLGFALNFYCITVHRNFVGVSCDPRFFFIDRENYFHINLIHMTYSHRVYSTHTYTGNDTFRHPSHLYRKPNTMDYQEWLDELLTLKMNKSNLWLVHFSTFGLALCVNADVSWRICFQRWWICDCGKWSFNPFHNLFQHVHRLVLVDFMCWWPFGKTLTLNSRLARKFFFPVTLFLACMCVYVFCVVDKAIHASYRIELRRS